MLALHLTQEKKQSIFLRETENPILLFYVSWYCEVSAPQGLEHSTLPWQWQRCHLK